MSKNIVFISGPIDPSIGGVQRVTWALSNYFKKNGYDCFFAYCGEDTPLIDEQHKICLNYHSKNNTEFYEKFRRFIIKNNISIIIDQDYYTAPILYSIREIKKEFNIIIYFCYHRNPFFGDFIDGNNPQIIIFKNRIKKLLHKEIYQPGFTHITDLCHKYVVLSDSYIKQFSQRFNIDKKQITSITNPTPFNLKESINLDSKEKIVLIVTRFVEKVKNIKSSLRIWKYLELSGYNGWKLVIAGYGEDEDFIKNYAKKLELKNCSFIGKLDDPTPYYKKSSILIMTSKCEGYPMTLIEAMQFGCVPIAFNNYSSLKDIITNRKNGIIIPPNKEKKFSRELLSLIKNKKLRDDLAQSALETSKYYSINRVGANWLKILTERN